MRSDRLGSASGATSSCVRHAMATLKKALIMVKPIVPSCSQRSLTAIKPLPSLQLVVIEYALDCHLYSGESMRYM